MSSGSNCLHTREGRGGAVDRPARGSAGATAGGEGTLPAVDVSFRTVLVPSVVFLVGNAASDVFLTRDFRSGQRAQRCFFYPTLKAVGGRV